MIAKNSGANNNDIYDQFRNSSYHSISNNHTNTSNSTMPLIEVREGNLLEFDWSDGDLIYLSSLCFPGNINIIISSLSITSS